MQLRLYDKPPAEHAGRFKTPPLVMYRHKDLSTGGSQAIKKWAASGSPHLHIQNLASTRSATFSILDSAGFSNCVIYLRRAFEEWERLPDERQHQLDAITLDDLFDRQQRETVAARLWQAFAQAGWTGSSAEKIATGAYAHVSFGTVACPVIWTVDEATSRERLAAVHPPGRGWPWIVAPGLTTASGVWTHERVRLRLRTCRDMGCPVVLVWSGGTGAPVDWKAMGELFREFST